MRLPRLRLSWIMIGVAFVALHLMLIKTTMSFLIPQELVIGGLPMAAILTIGHVVLRTRRDIRLFVVGFEAFGSVRWRCTLCLSSFSIEPQYYPTLSYSSSRLKTCSDGISQSSFLPSSTLSQLP